VSHPGTPDRNAALNLLRAARPDQRGGDAHLLPECQALAEQPHGQGHGDHRAEGGEHADDADEAAADRDAVRRGADEQQQARQTATGAPRRRWR